MISATLIHAGTGRCKLLRNCRRVRSAFGQTRELLGGTHRTADIDPMLDTVRSDVHSAVLFCTRTHTRLHTRLHTRMHTRMHTPLHAAATRLAHSPRRSRMCAQSAPSLQRLPQAATVPSRSLCGMAWHSGIHVNSTVTTRCRFGDRSHIQVPAEREPGRLLDRLHRWDD